MLACFHIIFNGQHFSLKNHLIILRKYKVYYVPKSLCTTQSIDPAPMVLKAIFIML